MNDPRRPAGLLEAIRTIGPHGGAYLLSAAMLRERVACALELADTYLFPVKANPDPGVLAIAVGAGAGLDLCSRGDLELARSVAAAGVRLGFTSPNLDTSLAADLVTAGVSIDLDSLQQVGFLPKGAAKVGLRVCAADAESSYGSKFGVGITDVPLVGDALRARGMHPSGLHVHEAYTTANGMAVRLVGVLEQIPPSVIGDLERVNIGGGWPVSRGVPAPSEEISCAIRAVRDRLSGKGFSGEIVVEPGEWVVGPCAWLVARVSAVKPHPNDRQRRIVVLDTATPVPCRPSDGPFEVLRDGEWGEAGGATAPCDIYGSANSGLDTLGVGVSMAVPNVGDVVAIAGQGAYARQLTGTFNERPVPPLVVFG